MNHSKLRLVTVYNIQYINKNNKDPYGRNGATLCNQHPTYRRVRQGQFYSMTSSRLFYSVLLFSAMMLPCYSQVLFLYFPPTRIVSSAFLIVLYPSWSLYDLSESNYEKQYASSKDKIF